MITVTGIITAIEEKDILPEWPDEPNDFIHTIQDEAGQMKDINQTKIIAHQELGKLGDFIKVQVIQTASNRLLATT